MDFPIHIGTVSMGLPIVHFKESQVEFSLNYDVWGVQWLSGRVLDSRLRGHRFEPHRRHCIVVLEQGTFILTYYWFNPGGPIPV